MEWYDGLVTFGVTAIIEVSPELKSFVASHIRAVWQLDMLLLLKRSAGNALSVSEIAAQMYLSADIVRSELTKLANAGIVRACGDDNFAYASGGELDAAVRQLDDAYARNRVGVINLIFAETGRD